MDQLLGMMGARHLSQIKEESDSREPSTCFLPPIAQQQQQQQQRQAGRASRPGVCGAGRRDVVRPSDPDSVVLCEQQRKLEDNKTLLEELSRIEAELRLEVEQQQETESVQNQQNKQLLQHLVYLSLGQRVTKPWVSSYFRMFPMHIYCLPVQNVTHRGRGRGLRKRR